MQKCVSGVAALFLAATTAASAQALLEPALGENVIAQRGDVELTLNDMDVKIRTMPPDLRAGYMAESTRASGIIDSMLLTKQIAAQAREMGIDKEPGFLEELELAATDLLARTLIERHVEQASIPNVAMLAKERYLADPEAMRPPPRIDVSHILVATDGLDEEKAKAMADAALAKVKAGESMVDVVAELDNPKVTTQVIQSIDLTRMDDRFAGAVERMNEVGQVAGPIRSRFGLHVIQIDRYDVSPVPTFEQVSETLQASLAAEAKDKIKKAFLASFSQKDVQLNNDVIASLRTRYVEAGKASGDASKAPTP